MGLQVARREGRGRHARRGWAGHEVAETRQLTNIGMFNGEPMVRKAGNRTMKLARRATRSSSLYKLVGLVLYLCPLHRHHPPASARNHSSYCFQRSSQKHLCLDCLHLLCQGQAAESENQFKEHSVTEAPKD